MSLYDRIAREGLSEGLSEDQQQRLFLTELKAYRSALIHERARWEADPDSGPFR